MKKLKKALFVARLQPLHKGHLHATRHILKKFGSVVIAIGSSQSKRERCNPFSFKERKDMLTEALKKERILHKCKIIGVRDFYDDGKWAREIEKKCKFDVVVTGNAWTRRCFQKKYQVVRPDFLNPEKYSSTKIRQMMNSRKDWKRLVPKEVYNYIENMKFRMKS